MGVYVTNSELTKELILSRERDELTDANVRMFQRMIKECTKTMRYRNAMDKDDCMSEAMCDILKYWRSFNPEHENANAFSFFTQTIKHGMAKGWRKLYKIKTTNMVAINESTGIFNI